jgi:GTP cyclohydrolase IB
MMLEDVQARADDRQLPIGEVGIRSLRYPATVWDRDHGSQATVAEISMSVHLRDDVKGVHLSRFVEVLEDSGAALSLQAVPLILDQLRQRLVSQRAGFGADFPFFMRRSAPVTGASARMDYQGHLSGRSDGQGTLTTVGVRVPVTSVCPCSKAISDYGAHNQRGYITLRVRPRGEGSGSAVVWLEDLIEIAEASASSPVFPLLKRPDERYVTMQAYDRPVFVEDMVRAAAGALADDDRMAWFSVEAVNDESIHNHAAFARIDSTQLQLPHRHEPAVPRTAEACGV